MSGQPKEESVLHFVDALQRNDWATAKRLMEEARAQPGLWQEMRLAWLLHLSVGLLPTREGKEAWPRFQRRLRAALGEEPKPWWERWRSRKRQGEEHGQEGTPSER